MPRGTTTLLPVATATVTLRFPRPHPFTRLDSGHTTLPITTTCRSGLHAGLFTRCWFHGYVPGRCGPPLPPPPRLRWTPITAFRCPDTCRFPGRLDPTCRSRLPLPGHLGPAVPRSRLTIPHVRSLLRRDYTFTRCTLRYIAPLRCHHMPFWIAPGLIPPPFHCRLLVGSSALDLFPAIPTRYRTFTFEPRAYGFHLRC